ncbi:MAG: hypothetical protein CL402_03415 [Acidiferrobacteraceae bacterium]|nr:hypothetical protein [Acidiferrobacteraceae bacterium]
MFLFILVFATDYFYGFMRNKTYFLSFFPKPIDFFSEFVINQLLCTDPDIAAKLTPLDGGLLRLEFKGELLFFLRVQNGQVRILPDAAGPTDAIVRMNAFVFHKPKVVLGPTFLPRLVEGIDGEANMVIEVQRFLSNFQPDWEEGLSKVVGDGLAYNICRGANMTKDWQDAARLRLIKNISDYFKHENTLLPTRRQTEKHFSKVNQLSEDVSKLELRLLSLNYWQ